MKGQQMLLATMLPNSLASKRSCLGARRGRRVRSRLTLVQYEPGHMLPPLHPLTCTPQETILITCHIRASQHPLTPKPSLVPPPNTHTSRAGEDHVGLGGGGGYLSHPVPVPLQVTPQPQLLRHGEGWTRIPATSVNSVRETTRMKGQCACAVLAYHVCAVCRWDALSDCPAWVLSNTRRHGCSAHI